MDKDIQCHFQVKTKLSQFVALYYTLTNFALLIQEHHKAKARDNERV